MQKISSIGMVWITHVNRHFLWVLVLMFSSIQIPFHQSGCDRAAELRHDIDQITALLRCSTAKFICFFKGKPFIVLHPKPMMGMLSAKPAGECYFLGLRNGSPLFAVATNQPLEGGKHIDLRRVGLELPALDVGLLGFAQSLVLWHSRHLFCSFCAGKMQTNLSGEKRWCTQCKQEVFPRINPVVIVLISHRNKILLGRQPRYPKGMYSCVAGFVELGEGIEQTVRREVKEEVGLTVTKVTYLASQPWPYPAQLMLAFEAEVSHPNIKIDDYELEDARWFAVEELKEMCAGKSQNGFFIPNTIAIARHLIEYFIDRFDSQSPNGSTL